MNWPPKKTRANTVGLWIVLAMIAYVVLLTVAAFLGLTHQPEGALP